MPAGQSWQSVTLVARDTLLYVPMGHGTGGWPCSQKCATGHGKLPNELMPGRSQAYPAGQLLQAAALVAYGRSLYVPAGQGTAAWPYKAEREVKPKSVGSDPSSQFKVQAINGESDFQSLLTQQALPYSVPLRSRHPVHKMQTSSRSIVRQLGMDRTRRSRRRRLLVQVFGQ